MSALFVDMSTIPKKVILKTISRQGPRLKNCPMIGPAPYAEQERKTLKRNNQPIL